MSTSENASSSLLSLTLEGRRLAFDVHPLYASILQDGATLRKGELIGLDSDLRRAVIAPFDGTIRLLHAGKGGERRLRVYLTESASAPFVGSIATYRN